VLCSGQRDVRGCRDDTDRDAPVPPTGRRPATGLDRVCVVTSLQPVDRPGHGPRADVGTRIRLALVNDYELVVRGLAAMLEPFDDRVDVVELEVGGTPDRMVDIALFDTFAGRRDTLARARELAESGTAASVVVYTWDATDEFVEVAAKLGVSAIIPKSVSGADLVELLQRVHLGERPGLDRIRFVGREPDGELSAREREVLALLALGLTNREIASELFLSVDTVKTYVRRLFAKLGVNNRTQAALAAERHDLAPPERRLERVAVSQDRRR
jgi:NarL family two-component system response regulator LiaR